MAIYRGEGLVMKDVQAMLKLASLGLGAKRISRELGSSRNTVRS